MATIEFAVPIIFKMPSAFVTGARLHLLDVCTNRRFAFADYDASAPGKGVRRAGKTRDSAQKTTAPARPGAFGNRV
jgi:hypothetical protein